MRLLKNVVLGTALLAPTIITPAALKAEDRVYHDEHFRDDHRWDRHEDQAYRIWVRENHRKYQEFSRLRAQDQQAYWAWRHNHSDAVLHIDIR